MPIIHKHISKGSFWTYELPTGYTIPDLLADINNVCFVGGPFRHNIEYQLERYHHPDTRAKASFKITQMCMAYTNYLMNQFPELQAMVAHATLAMQIQETLLKSTR